MEFKGLSVKHKSFGDGYIENIDEKNIYIYFPHRTTGNKNVTFEFPNSFIKEYLYCDDKRFNAWLGNNIINSTCSICSKYKKDIQEVDGILICDSCLLEKTVMCKQCQKPHIRENMVSVETTTYPYRKKEMCCKCAQDKTFMCEKCNTRYLLSEVEKFIFNGEVLCEDCFNDTAKICYVCGKTFDNEKCETVFSGSDEVDVCCDCLSKETFVCSSCNYTTLNSYIAKSKYIRTDEKICLDCVCHCGVCGEAVRVSKSELSFNKYYCTNCWTNNRVACPICGEEFVANDSNDICPDCIDSKEYIERIKQLDFSKHKTKHLRYYGIENIDRCKVFTNLYMSNKEYLLPTCKDVYQSLTMDIFGLTVVITYLRNDIVGNVRCLNNITMTDFRKSKVITPLYFKMKKWIPRCDDIVRLADENVVLFKYPVLLRVQTEFDKVYGKNWNGPDDYIEIGNYGDTTDFYIIGFIPNEN